MTIKIHFVFSNLVQHRKFNSDEQGERFCQSFTRTERIYWNFRKE